MSFEDRAVLAAHVQKKGLSANTLRDYEKERVPRVATVLRQEQVNPNPMLQITSRLMREGSASAVELFSIMSCSFQ